MAKRNTHQKPMPVEQAALLSAIIQNPEEDTPRLVYADWLQENGQPERAEFIRLQCGPARDFFDEGAQERKDQLLDRHGAEWAAEFQVRGVERVHFTRGFVESVSATGFAFITHQGAWFERTPLRSLTLTKASGRTREIVGSPYAHRLAELHVEDNRFADADLVGLLGDGRVAAADPYPNLRRLSVSAGPALGSGGLAAFAAAARLPRLESLDVENASVGHEGAVALAAAEGLDGLRALSLSRSPVGDDALLALLASPRRTALSRLHLFNCRVSAGGVAALADAPARPGFELLELGANPVARIDTDRLAVVLEKYPRLRIHLLQCPIPRAQREELLRRFGGRVFCVALDRSRFTRRITG